MARSGYIIAAVAVGGIGFVTWRWYTDKQAAAAASAAQWGQVTTSAEDLVGGQTPLALDTGTGGIDDGFPTINGEPYNPYTGGQSIEIDPTTGEIGIGDTEDIAEGELIAPVASFPIGSGAS